MNKKEFAKGVERLVNPMNVGTLHFMQAFNSLLPKSIQKKLVESSSQKIPYMGFVVEPYASFLCYEILDLEKAKELLPEGFEMIKTRIFEGDEPKYYCIFGCFRAHTSAFWGSRIEFYIIAQDQKTGLLSWVIMDYDSNTISYDKKNGLKDPNSSSSVVTINHEGTIFVDVKRDDGSRELVFDVNIKQGKTKTLDERLWLEGNLSVGYGKELAVGGDAGIFSLKFDPDEVSDGISIPLENLKLESNTWYPGLFKDTPDQVLTFPYAQHFISDSPGYASNITNKEELVQAVNALDFNTMKVFSTKIFQTMFLVGSALSLLISITLLLLVIFK